MSAARTASAAGDFEPALALRGDDREASLDEGPTLALGGLDDLRSGRDRAPKGRGGRPLSLLDLRSGRGEVHARPEQDQGGAPTAQPRDEKPVGESRTIPTTAAEKPSELAPARLKPLLDKAESNLRRTVAGRRKKGLTDPARHLEHFLDGSGEPITYNRDQARSFGPVRNAEEDAQGKIRAGILERARDLKDGESIKVEITPPPGEYGAVSHGLDLLRGFLGDNKRFNDNLATGRTTREVVLQRQDQSQRGPDRG